MKTIRSSSYRIIPFALHASINPRCATKGKEAKGIFAGIVRTSNDNRICLFLSRTDSLTIPWSSEEEGDTWTLRPEDETRDTVHAHAWRTARTRERAGRPAAAPPRKRATNRCVHVSSVRGNVCVYDVQRAFAVCMDTHARRSVAGVHKGVCVRTRIGACACMNVRARPCVPFLPLLTCAHAGARKRSNVRGVHDSLAPGILSRSRRPACGPPPYPPRLVPPFVQPPSQVIPPPGAREDPFTCTPRALPRILTGSSLFFSSRIAHRDFTHVRRRCPSPPSLSRFLSYSPIANSPRICARACASGRVCSRAHRRLCARRANISRALCSLLPFYEALHDDVHLCPPCQDAGPWVEHERARVRI